jgi:hypothetical protein
MTLDSHEIRLGNTYKIEMGDGTYISDLINLEDLRDLLDDELDDFYQAMEISKKWLIKLGFEYNEFEDLYQKDGFDVDIEDGVYCHFYLNEYGDWYKDIDYVHQLENLYFALTGEELTYNC